MLRIAAEVSLRYTDGRRDGPGRESIHTGAFSETMGKGIPERGTVLGSSLIGRGHVWERASHRLLLLRYWIFVSPLIVANYLGVVRARE